MTEQERGFLRWFVKKLPVHTYVLLLGLAITSAGYGLAHGLAEGLMCLGGMVVLIAVLMAYARD